MQFQQSSSDYHHNHHHERFEQFQEEEQSFPLPALTPSPPIVTFTHTRRSESNGWSAHGFTSARERQSHNTAVVGDGRAWKPSCVTLTDQSEPQGIEGFPRTAVGTSQEQWKAEAFFSPLSPPPPLTRIKGGAPPAKGNSTAPKNTTTHHRHIFDDSASQVLMKADRDVVQKKKKTVTWSSESEEGGGDCEDYEEHTIREGDARENSRQLLSEDTAAHVRGVAARGGRGGRPALKTLSQNITLTLSETARNQKRQPQTSQKSVELRSDATASGVKKSTPSSSSFLTPSSLPTGGHSNKSNNITKTQKVYGVHSDSSSLNVVNGEEAPFTKNHVYGERLSNSDEERVEVVGASARAAFNVKVEALRQLMDLTTSFKKKESISPTKSRRTIVHTEEQPVAVVDTAPPAPPPSSSDMLVLARDSAPDIALAVAQHFPLPFSALAGRIGGGAGFLREEVVAPLGLRAGTRSSTPHSEGHQRNTFSAPSFQERYDIPHTKTNSAVTADAPPRSSSVTRLSAKGLLSTSTTAAPRPAERKEDQLGEEEAEGEETKEEGNKKPFSLSSSSSSVPMQSKPNTTVSSRPAERPQGSTRIIVITGKGGREQRSRPLYSSSDDPSPSSSSSQPPLANPPSVPLQEEEQGAEVKSASTKERLSPSDTKNEPRDRPASASRFTTMGEPTLSPSSMSPLRVPPVPEEEIYSKHKEGKEGADHLESDLSRPQSVPPSAATQPAPLTHKNNTNNSNIPTTTAENRKRDSSKDPDAQQKQKPSWNSTTRTGMRSSSSVRDQHHLLHPDQAAKRLAAENEKRKRQMAAAERIRRAELEEYRLRKKALLQGKKHLQESSPSDGPHANNDKNESREGTLDDPRRKASSSSRGSSVASHRHTASPRQPTPTAAAATAGRGREGGGEGATIKGSRRAVSNTSSSASANSFTVDPPLPTNGRTRSQQSASRAFSTTSTSTASTAFSGSSSKGGSSFYSNISGNSNSSQRRHRHRQSYGSCSSLSSSALSHSPSSPSQPSSPRAVVIRTTRAHSLRSASVEAKLMSSNNNTTKRGGGGLQRKMGKASSSLASSTPNPVLRGSENAKKMRHHLRGSTAEDDGLVLIVRDKKGRKRIVKNEHGVVDEQTNANLKRDEGSGALLSQEHAHFAVVQDTKGATAVVVAAAHHQAVQGMVDGISPIPKQPPTATYSHHPHHRPPTNNPQQGGSVACESVVASKEILLSATATWRENGPLSPSAALEYSPPPPLLHAAARHIGHQSHGSQGGAEGTKRKKEYYNRDDYDNDDEGNDESLSFATQHVITADRSPPPPTTYTADILRAACGVGKLGLKRPAPEADHSPQQFNSYRHDTNGDGVSGRAPPASVSGAKKETHGHQPNEIHARLSREGEGESETHHDHQPPSQQQQGRTAQAHGVVHTTKSDDTTFIEDKERRKILESALDMLTSPPPKPPPSQHSTPPASSRAKWAESLTSDKRGDSGHTRNADQHGISFLTSPPHHATSHAEGEGKGDSSFVHPFYSEYSPPPAAVGKTLRAACDVRLPTHKQQHAHDSDDANDYNNDNRESEKEKGIPTRRGGSTETKEEGTGRGAKEGGKIIITQAKLRSLSEPTEPCIVRLSSPQRLNSSVSHHDTHNELSTRRSVDRLRHSPYHDTDVSGSSSFSASTSPTALTLGVTRKVRLRPSLSRVEEYNESWPGTVTSPELRGHSSSPSSYHTRSHHSNFNDENLGRRGEGGGVRRSESMDSISRGSTRRGEGDHGGDLRGAHSSATDINGDDGTRDYTTNHNSAGGTRWSDEAQTNISAHQIGEGSSAYRRSPRAARTLQRRRDELRSVREGSWDTSLRSGGFGVGVGAAEGSGMAAAPQMDLGGKGRTPERTRELSHHTHLRDERAANSTITASPTQYYSYHLSSSRSHAPSVSPAPADPHFSSSSLSHSTSPQAHMNTSSTAPQHNRSSSSSHPLAPPNASTVLGVATATTATTGTRVLPRFSDPARIADMYLSARTSSRQRQIGGGGGGAHNTSTSSGAGVGVGVGASVDSSNTISTSNRRRIRTVGSGKEALLAFKGGKGKGGGGAAVRIHGHGSPSQQPLASYPTMDTFSTPSPQHQNREMGGEEAEYSPQPHADERENSPTVFGTHLRPNLWLSPESGEHATRRYGAVREWASPCGMGAEKIYQDDDDDANSEKEVGEASLKVQGNATALEGKRSVVNAGKIPVSASPRLYSLPTRSPPATGSDPSPSLPTLLDHDAYYVQHRGEVNPPPHRKEAASIPDPLNAIGTHHDEKDTNDSIRNTTNTIATKQSNADGFTFTHKKSPSSAPASSSSVAPTQSPQSSTADASSSQHHHLFVPSTASVTRTHYSFPQQAPEGYSDHVNSTSLNQIRSPFVSSVVVLTTPSSSNDLPISRLDEQDDVARRRIDDAPAATQQATRKGIPLRVSLPRAANNNHNPNMASSPQTTPTVGTRSPSLMSSSNARINTFLVLPSSASEDRLRRVGSFSVTRDERSARAMHDDCEREDHSQHEGRDTASQRSFYSALSREAASPSPSPLSPAPVTDVRAWSSAPKVALTADFSSRTSSSPTPTLTGIRGGQEAEEKGGARGRSTASVAGSAARTSSSSVLRYLFSMPMAEGEGGARLGGGVAKQHELAQGHQRHSLSLSPRMHDADSRRAGSPQSVSLFFRKSDVSRSSPSPSSEAGIRTTLERKENATTATKPNRPEATDLLVTGNNKNANNIVDEGPAMDWVSAVLGPAAAQRARAKDTSGQKAEEEEEDTAAEKVLPSRAQSLIERLSSIQRAMSESESED